MKNNYAMRTDMAVEFKTKARQKIAGAKFVTKKIEGLTITECVLDKVNALGRPSGHYITLESPLLATDESPRLCNQIIKVLTEYLRACMATKTNILVVGIGNENLVSDSLGPRTIERIMVSRSEGGKLATGYSSTAPIVSKLCPSVLGNTGIESFDVIKSVIKQIKPDVVVAIDSLCSRALARLGTSFQIATSGIVPGSGVGNHQTELSAKTLGVPVIAIGVPMIVGLYCLTDGDVPKNMIKCKSKIDATATDFVVSPKELDLVVDASAKILAEAINRANFD